MTLITLLMIGLSASNSAHRPDSSLAVLEAMPTPFEIFTSSYEEPRLCEEQLTCLNVCLLFLANEPPHRLRRALLSFVARARTYDLKHPRDWATRDNDVAKLDLVLIAAGRKTEVFRNRELDFLV